PLEREGLARRARLRPHGSGVPSCSFRRGEIVRPHADTRRDSIPPRRRLRGVGAPRYVRSKRRQGAIQLGDPQDVAGVVLFLWLETARHITGAVISIDGGYLL
ncbi:MAG TPA: SDR family oxidoreductase, partial [Gemmatimonadetes bacterium]|nr:SDR family oxidoreductase [Gemmatimonadota bacterium]